MNTAKRVTKKKTVGVIGLGIMGSAIAGNLLQDGFEVHGYDADARRHKALAKMGILVAADVAAVALNSKIILLSLPSVIALEMVTDALVIAAGRGTIVAELSTLPAQAKDASRQKLAAAGIELLDCPLSGTGAQAKTRDLAVYASGNPQAIKKIKPVLAGFARAQYNVGEFGKGMQMKLVANLLVAIHNVSTAEALLLGTRMGLDARQIVDVVSDGAGGSRMLQVRGPMMCDRSWDNATMKVDVWEKDMNLIGDAIKSHCVPAPLFSACIPIYHAAQALGNGERDTAVVYDVLEKWARPLTEVSKA